MTIWIKILITLAVFIPILNGIRFAIRDRYSIDSIVISFFGGWGTAVLYEFAFGLVIFSIVGVFLGVSQ